jgi:membrane fusion protein, multidrug efflux system
MNSFPRDDNMGRPPSATSDATGPAADPAARRPRPSAAAAVLSLALAVAACDDAPAPPQGAAPPPEVTATTITPADVPLTYEYAGRVAGYREVEVRPQVGGTLLERSFEEGARVRVGDLLFRIDPRPYEVALARAQAQLQQAQARLRQAEDNYGRQRELFERRVTSEAVREQALAQRDQTRAGVALAQAEVEAARLDLGYTEVHAPVAGVTALRSPAVGSLVQPQQTLLTTITQLDPAYVNYSFTDAEVAAFRALNRGRAHPISPADLTVELRFGDGSVYPHPGRVDVAAQSVDPQTGTVQARVIFPNEEGILLPGQFVRIVVKGVSLQDAIAIPKRAVSQGPQGPFVYVVSEGDRAAARPVRLGQELGQAWVVREGLRPGDRIVTDGVVRVRPGAPVRIAEPAPNETVASPAGAGAAGGAAR